MSRRKKRGRSKKKRKRHVLTREECQRGYARALEICLQKGWGTHAWFFRKIRGHYRRKRREAAAQESARPRKNGQAPPAWEEEPPF